MDPMNPMAGGGMTPEQMQAYLEYVSGQGAFEEQDRAIQQQLAMANALRNRPQDQYRTGKGAALGGLGNVVNQYLGSRDVANAQREDRLLQQAQIAALRKMAAKANPRLLPGYDAGAGTLNDPSGAAYIMPGPL